MKSIITPDLPERKELLELFESASQERELSIETSSTAKDPLDRKRFGYNAPHVTGVVPFHHMSDSQVKETLSLIKAWMAGNCRVIKRSSG